MIDKFKEKGIIESGTFHLKSGLISNTYINLKKIISYPDLHLQLCNEIFNKINKEEKILICGTPYGAVPFASYISIKNDIPMIFLRKGQKEYGTNQLIEGEFTEGQKVILIEDVITSGKSVIDAAEKLEGHGLIISQIIAAFSRAENKELMYKDIPIEYLYHMNDI